MLKKQIWQIVGVLLALASCTPVYAQGGRMAYLGNAHVDGSRDRDSIKVRSSSGAFRAIQLRVSGGAINFERVVVRYGNGTSDEVQIRSRIPDGGRTRIIDLPGARRIIQSVDLWYSKDRGQASQGKSLPGCADEGWSAPKPCRARNARPSIEPSCI